MSDKITFNKYDYNIGHVNFSKVDKDGDIEITFEDSSEYYGGDVRRYINVEEMERMIAWAKTKE